MLRFVFEPATDCSVDPQYALHDPAGDTGIYIQDCRAYGGGYAIAEQGDEGTPDSFWVRDLGTAKTFTTAKAKAIAAYRRR